MSLPGTRREGSGPGNQERITSANEKGQIMMMKCSNRLSVNLSHCHVLKQRKTLPPPPLHCTAVSIVFSSPLLLTVKITFFSFHAFSSSAMQFFFHNRG
jgi:hypothetical protein